MHSVLFVATMPDQADIQQNAKWKGFLGWANNSIKLAKGVERLAANVWLVNLRVSPDPFVSLGSAALDHGIDYRILGLDDEPQWLPANSP